MRVCRLWELYVESKLDWRLNKTERDRRDPGSVQDMRAAGVARRNDPKLAGREAVKLSRRVFRRAV